MTPADRRAAYSRQDLLLSGHGKLFGPEFGRLPIPPMLMFDTITSITDNGGENGLGNITAELNLSADMWFFHCHFVEDPVMPGCLGLDALWQLVGFWLGWAGMPGKGRALGVGTVRFSGQVMTNCKKIRYDVSVKRVVRSRLTLGIADGAMYADGDRLYQAKDLKVGLFDIS